MSCLQTTIPYLTTRTKLCIRQAIIIPSSDDTCRPRSAKLGPMQSKHQTRNNWLRLRLKQQASHDGSRSKHIDLDLCRNTCGKIVSFASPSLCRCLPSTSQPWLLSTPTSIRPAYPELPEALTEPLCLKQTLDKDTHEPLCK